MHHITFLQDLSVVMIVAGLATVLFRQFKQPVVLGYILAGVLIGPHTPPFSLIAEESTVQTLADLGVIFLMFALGLEFNLGKLKKVGATAFIAASLEIVLMVWAGSALGNAFGWSRMDSIFLGAILAISSTTIIIKALQELGKTKEPFANLIFGILIVEDILGIVMIALLSGLATTGSLVAGQMAMTIFKLCAFLGVLLVGGLIIIPRIIGYVARFRSDEMLLVTVVGMCFGVSLLTVKMGYSVALGAFLIGAIIAEAREIARIEILMHPLRDLFSAVFFVSIGLLIDPKLLADYWVPVLVISLVVIVGKVLSCGLGTFLAGNDTRTSLRVGMGLSQIGEFSFIIATLGLSLNVTSGFIYPIAVAVSAITTLTTPYLIRSSDSLVAWFDRVAPKPLVKWLEAYSEWVGGLMRQRDGNVEGKLLGKLGVQIAVNLLLVAGVFIAAGFLHRKALAWWPQFPGGEDGVKAATWVAAMIAAFPSLVAIWRKSEVGGMLVAEMSVNSDNAGPNAPALRSIIAGTIFAASSAALILVLLLMSSTILPSRNTLILAVLILVISAFVFYRGAVRLYSRAHAALQDTFAQRPDPAPHAAAALAPLLREAKLVTSRVGPGSPAAGRLISELRLRSETGASIVGIDRQGTSIVNPGPDEELAEGDDVLLIGRPEQLEAARRLLGDNLKAET